MAPNWGGGILLNPYLVDLHHPRDGRRIGWIIGVLITVGKMNNFIVTLAMLLILRGLMLAFTAGNADRAASTSRRPTSSTGSGTQPRSTFPASSRSRSPSSRPRSSSSIGHVVLNHRRFGRELYAIGGNRAAAIASGIDADKRIRQVYMHQRRARRLRRLDAGGPRRLDPGQSRRGLHLHRHGGRGHRRHQPAGRARHDAGGARRRAAALDHRPRPQPDERLGVLDQGDPGPHHHARHVHRRAAGALPRFGRRPAAAQAKPAAASGKRA